eukprot:m.37403 g.37403  ORF g.37403 m.37403 type:complete len:62 (+) comp5443_c0_seq2:1453-1638(+)
MSGSSRETPGSHDLKLQRALWGAGMIITIDTPWLRCSRCHADKVLDDLLSHCILPTNGDAS